MSDTANEAPITPDEDGAAEALAVVDQLHADKHVVAKVDTIVVPGESDGKVEEAQTPDEAKTPETPEDSPTPAEEAKAEETPEDDGAPGTAGIDWLEADDAVRAEIESKELSEEAIAALRASHEEAKQTKADAVRGMNKKFQELAEERKAFQAERAELEAKAKSYDALIDDALEKPEEVTDFDPELATEAEKFAELERRQEAKIKQAESQRSASEQEVTQRQEALKQDTLDYFETVKGTVTEEQWTEALSRVDTELTRHGYTTEEAVLNHLTGDSGDIQSRFSQMLAPHIEDIVERDELAAKNDEVAALKEELSKRDAARTARASSPKPNATPGEAPAWASIKDPKLRARAKTEAWIREQGSDPNDIEG